MANQLLDQARQLSVEERIELVEAIWDSIAATDAALPLSDTQRAELDRRLAEHEADPNDLVSWDDVKAGIQARLRQ